MALTARYRTRSIAVAPVCGLPEWSDTSAGYPGRRRGLRKRGHAPGIGAATTTRHGAIRGRRSPQRLYDHTVATGASTNLSTTCRRGSRNSAHQWRRCAQAQWTHWGFPNPSDRSVGRCPQPTPGRSARYHAGPGTDGTQPGYPDAAGWLRGLHQAPSVNPAPAEPWNNRHPGICRERCGAESY